MHICSVVLITITTYRLRLILMILTEYNQISYIFLIPRPSEMDTMEKMLGEQCYATQNTYN